MARMIDADAMLAELKPITYEMEHTSVLVSDMSNIMRNWVERQPTLTQPNETPPCYQPDGDGCAYQCYDGQDEPIEKCKACPLCCSDKQRHYTPQNKLKRAGLYGKYTVLKNEDGSLITNCFVLRPEKDPAAVAALRAYAATTDNAELADDIINWVGAELPEPPGKERNR